MIRLHVQVANCKRRVAHRVVGNRVRCCLGRFLHVGGEQQRKEVTHWLLMLTLEQLTAHSDNTRKATATSEKWLEVV